MDNFKAALDKVLEHEGGYVNHPKDPGGATNKGVTQRVYDGYRTRNGLSTRSVREIAPVEISAIYRASYWDLARCDRLPVGVSYVVFDGAVNSGVRQSAIWLQRALGVKADGLIGPATISAANEHPDHARLIDVICEQRLKFLKALKTWTVFGRGWATRVEQVRKTGKAWARGNQAPVMLVAEPTEAKALVEDVKKAPSAALGDAGTGAGTMGVVLSQMIDQLTPLSNNDFVAKVVTVMTIISLLLAFGGIAYGIYARHRKAEVKDAVA